VRLLEESENSELQKKEILRKIVSSEGRERLNRVKIVKPELVSQIEEYLINSYLTGKIKKVISEEEIIELLKALSEKREFRIRK
jgi:programmed cell death protein 5